jgi:photosystem II stability/assembly factor-like uncharacterized protein
MFKFKIGIVIAAVLASFVSALGATNVDLWLSTKSNKAGFEQIAKLVTGVGKIIQRDERSGKFRIRVNPGIEADNAIKLLRSRQGVTEVKIAEEPIVVEGQNCRSVRALKNRLDQINKMPKEGRPKTAYLKAWLYYMQQRAYPFDTVDWDALQQGSIHRSNMPVANLSKKSNKSSTGVSALGTSFGTWEWVGPKNLDIPYRVYYGIRPLSGRTNSIAYDPTNANTIYLGGATGGIWKTTNRGVTWTCLADRWEKMPVSSIAIDPVDPQTIYVGSGDFHGSSGYSLGVMKSTDGGATWTNQGNAQFGNYAVSQVLVDPEDPQIVTVTTGRGAGYNGKVYRSTDGGTSWNVAVNVSAPWSDCGFGIPSASVRTYYAVAGGGGGRLYRSADGGVTWTAMAAPSGATLSDTLDVAASKVDPATVYLLSASDQKIYKSTDRGATWSDITGTFPGGYNWSQSWYDYHITTSKRGSNDLVFVGLIDIVYSPDSGATWTSIGGPTYSDSAITHNDQHCIGINPLNLNEICVGNDGGIFLYTYNGASWTSKGLNAALGITQFYQADWHPFDSKWMLGGTQDNATPMANGDLNNWLNVGGGDGGFCCINPTNPNNQYCTSQGLSVYKTENAWANTQYISPTTGSDNVAFIAPIELDASSPNLLYAGTNYLYRWDNTSSSWTAHLGNQKFTDGVLSVIRVAPSDSNRIYVGTNDGMVWMSKNAGSSWSRINSGTVSLPNRYISSISISRVNPDNILVGISGTGTAHLWKCTNPGSASRTWASVDGSGATSLPDVPVNAVARDYRNYDTMWFVGTDVGVFMTSDGGSNWGNATEPYGLPNVQVNALGTIPSTGHLYAATFGRGMWRITTPSTAFTISSLKVNPNPVQGGYNANGSVTISDAAYPGGAKVYLTSSDKKLLKLPTFVLIPAGKTTASFLAKSTAVNVTSPVTVTATIEDSTESTQIVINPPGILSLTVNPTTVRGGNSLSGTVTIGTLAPAGGALIRLAVDNAKAAKVEWKLVIPEGQSSADFTVNTFAVKKSTLVTLRGAYPGPSKYAPFTVLPPYAISALSLSPTSVKGGVAVTGTVKMNGPAPSDTVVTLLSSNTLAATVPVSVTIPAGATQATFTVTTLVVKSNKTVTMTAAYNGVKVKSKLTVKK